jgi:hypothetical protein
VALVSLAQRTSNITTAAACWEIRTTASGKVNVQEIGISLVTAAATVIGIGTPAAIGVTPTSPQTFLREDTADQTAVTTAAVAWATGPTVPANFFRRWSFPATIGSGIIFTFPQGLVIPVSSSLVLWNILGGATLDVYATVDE